MEELTEVITAAECHPHQCNVFVYSSSKGTIRLCDMRAAALCDRHSKCKYLDYRAVMVSQLISGKYTNRNCKHCFFYFIWLFGNLRKVIIHKLFKRSVVSLEVVDFMRSCKLLSMLRNSKSENLFLSKVFEEPEDPSSRSFFSEIISSISDVKFSHSGRYMMTRDYLSVKVWDLNMENRPVETYQVHKCLSSDWNKLKTN